jgi:hypothetical protein
MFEDNYNPLEINRTYINTKSQRTMKLGIEAKNFKSLFKKK